MSALDVLVAARKRIERPECWTKGAFSRDSSGKDLGFGLDNDSAACWCASGAVYVSCERDFAADGEALNLLMAASPTGTIAEFNDADTTTHADVLAWFDRAIEAARLAATPRAASGDNK